MRVLPTEHPSMFQGSPPTISTYVNEKKYRTQDVHDSISMIVGVEKVFNVK